ncbi:hypothetical protein [Dyadobacter pollutisoli]|jgi:hypothetical protein|uniref:Uncharacterized protein n=1 Tax=Dyadobacter pollutisoli TaxID=2910158 RepID=A0A9E8SLR0_9BACT|nr:hypothetical protein [Dyadobacter pollutisoli]WAC13368.1 hypothetical protein ON006_05270 [Dyadobacter pollutisoli]
MKRMLNISALSFAILTTSSSKSQKGTHTYKDGREHADHTDSTKAASVDTTGIDHSHDTTAHGQSHDRP